MKSCVGSDKFPKCIVRVCNSTATYLNQLRSDFKFLILYITQKIKIN